MLSPKRKNLVVEYLEDRCLLSALAVTDLVVEPWASEVTHIESRCHRDQSTTAATDWFDKWNRLP